MSQADGDLELPPPPPEAVMVSPKRRAPPPPAPGSLIVMEDLEVREAQGLELGDTELYDEPPPSPGGSRSIISGSVSLPPLPDTPKSTVHSF